MHDDRKPASLESSDEDRIEGSYFPIDGVHAYRGQVWHYTDAVGLEGIVSKGELYATDAVMLNDPQELRYGADQIKAWYEQFGSTIGGKAPLHAILTVQMKAFEESIEADPAFVVCASTSLLLSQWRNYASNSGFAIRLDTSHSFGVVDGYEHELDSDGRRTPGGWTRPTSSIPKRRFTILPSWVKVLYNPGEQMNRIGEVMNRMAAQGGAIDRLIRTDSVFAAKTIVNAKIAALAATLKHPDYAEEKEVRLIGYRPDGHTAEHRSSGRGVIPYLRVITTSDPTPNGVIRRQTRLPILDVRVGPPQGDTEKQRIHGARSLLHAHGYTHVDPRGSGIPFLP